MRHHRRTWILGAVVVAIAAAAFAPWAVRAWWWSRSSNPVRRGMVRAQQLGCFHCHGPLGTVGVGDPFATSPDAAVTSVPEWTGGSWMMVVKSDAEIRAIIRNGSASKPSATHQHMTMPAYRLLLRGSDLDDLTALFNAASGRKRPDEDSAAARGFALTQKWGCFSCHGPAACGGLANPLSMTGYIPGWYGADFRDLVRDKAEFTRWVREGTTPRLATNPIARRFLSHEIVKMPHYELTDAELDDLWAYVQWLDQTHGSVDASPHSW